MSGMAFILAFIENLKEHLSNQLMLRRAGYDVVATDDPAYFSQVVTLVPVDLLLMVDAAGARLLQVIRWEHLSEAPAVVIIDGFCPELAAGRQSPATILRRREGQGRHLLHTVAWQTRTGALPEMMLSYSPA